jgi:polyisoprenoid-binding protein YceI
MKFKALPLILFLTILATACGSTSNTGQTQEPASTSPPTHTTAAESENGDATQDTGAEDQANSSTQFVILTEQSEARFYINEVLRGEPKQVEGINQDISGVISIDSLDPLSVSIQPVEVPAGSFVTDNGFRNRAISDAILQAGRYPTIVFTPTAIDGLPESAEPGEAYTFEVTGDLTIRETTLPVTFQVSLTAESTDRISGLASTTIQRADYGLNIPSVPQVADVSQEVTLEFDFSASRSGG